MGFQWKFTSAKIMLEKSKKQAAFVRLRKLKKVTQKQVADTLGVSIRAVHGWEAGEYQPNLSIPQIKALCKLLDVSVHELPDNFSEGVG